MSVNSNKIMCPKCHSKIPKNSKYCFCCGLVFENDDVKDYSEKYYSYLLEQITSKNLTINDNPNLFYFLLGWNYSIMKGMKSTTIYLLFSYLIFLFLIYNIDAILLLCVLVYPVGFSFLIVLAILAIKYHIILLKKYINKDCIKKLNKFIKDKPNASKDEIIFLINKSKDNYYIFIISLIISIVLLVLVIFNSICI